MKKAIKKQLSDLDKVILKYGAPTVYLYARWVLEEARKRGIKKLYFLARDGYTVMKAAEIICRKYGIDTELSYFYCSRHSLRMAAYRFFDDSAYTRFFDECYCRSPKNLLERAEFSFEERKKVYRKIRFYGNEKKILSKKEYRDFSLRLKKSAFFNSVLKKKSDRANINAVGYIKQEGMDRQDKIGIVDLGWTGSVQQTLCTLLRAENINSVITGFYLGMLEAPPEISGCEYVTMLFDGDKNADIKAWFSQNLMESLCTAPHGMTAGYAYDGEKYFPLSNKNENNEEIVLRISEIIAEYAEGISDFEYNERHEERTVLNLLKKLMLYPKREEAGAFEIFKFCDDFSGAYSKRLVKKPSMREVISGYFPLKGTVPLYWYAGSLALSESHVKWLHKGLYLARNYFRYKIKEMKSKREE